MSDFNEERLRHQGLLQEKEQAAKVLAMRLDELRGGIRRYFDPFVAVAEIEAERGLQLAIEFSDAQNEYKALIAEISVIRKALGR